MSNDLIVLSARADEFTRALADHVGADRLFWRSRRRVGRPKWQFQEVEVQQALPGASPSPGSIEVEQHQSEFLLLSAAGLEVTVWSTPPFKWFYAKNPDRSRPAMFVANVRVDLCESVEWAGAPQDGELQFEQGMVAPRPHEEELHSRISAQGKAYRAAFKKCGFKVVEAVEAPFLERSPASHDSATHWTSVISWEAEFELERKKVNPFVEAVVKILEFRLPDPAN